MPPKYKCVGLALNRVQGGQLRKHGITRLTSRSKGGRSPVFLTGAQLSAIRRSYGRPYVLRMGPHQHRYNMMHGGGVWTDRAKRLARQLIPHYKSDIMGYAGRLGNYVSSRYLDKYNLGDFARKGINKAAEWAIDKAMEGGGMRRRRRSRSRSRARGSGLRSRSRSKSRGAGMRRRSVSRKRSRSRGRGLYLGRGSGLYL